MAVASGAGTPLAPPEAMHALDKLIPAPQLLEIDHVDVAAPPMEVWALLRHGDLARSPLVRALFAVRALPERLHGRPAAPFSLRLDDVVSTPSRPGFSILIDEPPHEVAVGAIGQVWKGEIPFVHVASPQAFAQFEEPGYAKVAWALRVLPRGDRDSRVEVEVRVDATDDDSWRKFRRYFRIIGIGSRFIRHVLLGSLAKELGAPEALEDSRPLAGDELLADAGAELTRSVTIAAPPAEVWPWLVQMGCGRGGFYAIDAVDNAGEPSAREVHPELAAVSVGDIIPTTIDGDEGFEVLRVEPDRCLVLGALQDVMAARPLPFAARRPPVYWHVTWSFVLERLDERTTRLHARARAAFSPDERLRLAWIRPVHRLMQAAQLRHLAARVEKRLPRDGWRDVLAGAGGAVLMAGGLLTPFLRERRTVWGVDAKTAEKDHPGDDLVPRPDWSWTHAVEIDAPANEVWPWIAQVGADRAGFYSYQWLENLVGCRLRNAESIHPDWELRQDDELRLHPGLPAFRVVRAEPPSCLIAYRLPDEDAVASGRSWAAASWAFVIEPLGAERCRLISRYRVAISSDLQAHLAFGAALVEPIGFAMDRRMLLGVKKRAEARARLMHQTPA